MKITDYLNKIKRGCYYKFISYVTFTVQENLDCKIK